MCLGGSAPAAPTPAPVITKREGSATGNRFKKRRSNAGGVFANIFTTPLGDSGFNTNTQSAKLLGNTTPTP